MVQKPIKSIENHPKMPPSMRFRRSIKITPANTHKVFAKGEKKSYCEKLLSQSRKAVWGGGEEANDKLA